MAFRTLASAALAIGALLGGSVVGLSGSASASTQALACSYRYVCGKGANGNSFAHSRCGPVYELPNLIGNGPLNNNQTPGTIARFYDRSGGELFQSIAPEQRTVNWTPVWYVKACLE